MGSGKSHVGRKLAKYLRVPLLDLDAQIELQTKTTINDIFAKKGETYFRLIERHILHETAFTSPSIIATGGGTPCFFDNIQWMNRRGTCVFLDASLDVLVQRLWKGRLKRPLIRSLTQAQLPTFIEHKLAQRRHFYEQADVQLKVHSAEQDIAGDLYRHLNYIIGH